MRAELKIARGGRPPSTVPQVRIEKGVPLPEVHPAVQFPWADMQVGDSFFVPATLDVTSMMARVRSKFRYWRLGQCPRPDVGIVIRKVDGGLRCWRLR